eukprot:scaffold184559_cov33-Tisochrysis_lutea.AAC.1
MHIQITMCLHALYGSGCVRMHCADQNAHADHDVSAYIVWIKMCLHALCGSGCACKHCVNQDVQIRIRLHALCHNS